MSWFPELKTLKTKVFLQQINVSSLPGHVQGVEGVSSEAGHKGFHGNKGNAQKYCIFQKYFKQFALKYTVGHRIVCCFGL